MFDELFNRKYLEVSKKIEQKIRTYEVKEARCKEIIEEQLLITDNPETLRFINEYVDMYRHKREALEDLLKEINNWQV